MANGINEKKRIVGTDAPHPFLYNLSNVFVERFRKQISLVDLQFQGDPGVIRKAVWACYQEEPVEFQNYTLYDKGAYPEPALSGRILSRVTRPWAEPDDGNEREALERAKELMARLRAKNERAKVRER
jgi:hypothetical protein